MKKKQELYDCSMHTENLDLEPLRQWFLETKRWFPWREKPTPYQVWVSEVMLQQTQSSRVIDYYIRWMERFPTIEALSKAPLEYVLKTWEGLGYYSRAKALHMAAAYILENFDGKLPDDPLKLSSIKGLGHYTTGAILAFGFHKKKAAVDGNVIRVLCRLFQIQDDIAKSSTQKKLRALAETLLPDHAPWEIVEALIELGATSCRPKPSCVNCPLQSQCQSYRQNVQQELPVSSKKTKYEKLFREVAVIIKDDKVLLLQAKEGSICAGLWEFPFFDCKEGGLTKDESLKKIEKELKLTPLFQQVLPQEKQSFTRFRLVLYPKLYFAKDARTLPNHTWHDIRRLDELAFSSGHKRILQALQRNLLLDKRGYE